MCVFPSLASLSTLCTLNPLSPLPMLFEFVNPGPKDTFTDQKVTFLSTRPTIEVDMDCPESPGKRHKTDSRLLVASIAFMTSAPIFLLLAIIVRRRIFLEKLGSRYQVLDSRGDVEMESAESNPVSPSASSEKKSDECTHNSPFQGLVSKGWIQFLNSVKSIMPPFHLADARDLKVESAVPIQRLVLALDFAGLVAE